MVPADQACHVLPIDLLGYGYGDYIRQAYARTAINFPSHGSQLLINPGERFPGLNSTRR